MNLGQKQSFPGRCVGLHANGAYEAFVKHLFYICCGLIFFGLLFLNQFKFFKPV